MPFGARTMPVTTARCTTGVSAFATAGRVARTRTLPSRVFPSAVTWATCRARAKVRSAEPSGSRAMFSGVCPAASPKWATVRESVMIGSWPVAGAAAIRPSTSAAVAAVARRGSRGM